MNEPLLMTPEIASTAPDVKTAMQTDLSPQSPTLQHLSQHLRSALLQLAAVDAHAYAAIVLPGDSATLVEATLQTVVPKHPARILVAVNGICGTQIMAMLEQLHLPHDVIIFGQTTPIDPQAIVDRLRMAPKITHFIMCHQDPTAGVLNPLAPLFHQLQLAGVTTILDARATFGGIPIDCATLGIDYLITVFHHALQSVPGFGAVIAKRKKIAQTAGQSLSIALDLYEQLAYMELTGGLFRHGAPVQSVIAADRAVSILLAEGGTTKRYQHLRQLQQTLGIGMTALGFAQALQARGFEIAAGIAHQPSFRVATRAWSMPVNSTPF